MIKEHLKKVEKVTNEFVKKNAKLKTFKKEETVDPKIIKEQILNAIRLKKEIIAELKADIEKYEQQLKEVKDEKGKTKLRSKDVQPVA